MRARQRFTPQDPNIRRRLDATAQVRQPGCAVHTGPATTVTGHLRT